MALLDDLIDALTEAVRGVGGPFRAYSKTTAEAPSIPRIRTDPVFGPVVDALEAATGRDIDDLSRREIVEQIRTDPGLAGEVRNAQRKAERRTSTMPVTYPEWTEIAFEVAREKGADFSTTQSEIRRGDAPTVEAIEVFAEIWNRRKQEIASSRQRARSIAQAEIWVNK